MEIDFSNYATKSDFKNETDVHTLTFAKKADSSDLKLDIEKLDIDKLERSTKLFKQLESKVDMDNLKKLSDIVDKEVVKIDAYDG